MAGTSSSVFCLFLQVVTRKSLENHARVSLVFLLFLYTGGPATARRSRQSLARLFCRFPYICGCGVRPVSFACLLSWRDMTCRPLFLVFLLSSFSFVFFFCYICLECVLRAELEMICLAARSLLFLLYMRRYWRGQRRRQWQRL